ncbi:MAG: polysaccharide biosynthesis C-terminal domain-containing protein [Patescibacteria group bacterium]
MAFIKQSMYTLITRGIQVISAFIVTIVVAQTLGTLGTGTYELFQLLVTFSVTLGAFGIGHASVYLIKKEKADMRETLSTVFTVGLVWGIILGGLVYIFYTVFPSLVAGLPPSAILIGAALIPCALIESYLIQALLIEFYMQKQALLVGFKNGCLLVCLVLALLIFDAGTTGVIYSVVIAYILSSLMTTTAIWRLYRLRLQFSRAVFNRLLSFGVRSWLANIFLILNFRLDMFLVNHFADIHAVGSYSVAVTVAGGLFLLPSAIGPLLYSRWSAMPPKKIAAETPQLSRQILLLSTILALILAAYGRTILSIVYGNSFIDAFPALVILLPGIVMTSINYVLFNSLAALGKPGLNAISLIVGLVINIALNIVLIPYGGIVGAALASTVSYTLTTLITIAFVLRYHPGHASRNFIFPTLSDTLILAKRLKQLVSHS